MKKFLLPMVLLIPAFTANAQILNGDFEDWTKMILFEHPAMGISTFSSNYETFFNDGSLNCTRIDSEDGSGLRVENIQAGDEIIPGWFITGENPNQEGEGLLFGGGFPATDANVSGISMDIRFNIPQTSPGFVLVQFKNNGVPVGEGNMGTGTYMFPISGVQEWSHMQWNFDAPLGVVPDQCVIGVVCANVLSDDQNYEVGAFAEVDNIALVNSNDVVPAGTFEGWAFVEPLWTPDDMVVDVDPFFPAYEQSPEAHNGNLALKLTTIQRDGDESPQVGRTWLAADTDGEVVPNIMLNETHTTLHFYYKYTPVNDDVAVAMVTFYNETETGYVPVMNRSIELNGNSDWEEVEYDFNAELEANFLTADAMSILFESSQYAENSEPQVGSTLLVDDVTMSGLLFDGMINATVKGGKGSIKAYPNPTLARVTMDLTIPRTGFYKVFNEQGTQVDIREFTSQRFITHDLTNMPSGKYIFRFTHNGGVQIAQVIKL